MVIGIDCSRAFVKERTGTENYSYSVVSEILRLPASLSLGGPTAREHSFVLFTRPNAVIPSWIYKCKNVTISAIKYRYLWTQIGLSMNTWRKFQISSTKKQANSKSQIQNIKQKLDVLWIPAHTLPVLRRPNLRTVVTIHGLEYQWLPEYKNILQRWYLPLSTIYAASRADKLIAVSKFTKNQLVKQLQTIPNKIKVVYEGVDVSSEGCPRNVGTFHSGDVTAWRKWRIEENKYILFVGTLMPRKNLTALVEAFSLMQGEYSEYKLVIAGGRGWMTEEIFAAPSKCDVQEKVVFSGRVSDDELRVLYQGAALYVQPSHTEGFGLPILEAMSEGVPIVSSDGGALVEVVATAGIIVKLGEEFSAGLASAMSRVLSNKQLRDKLVSMGKKRVSELTWEKSASKTLRVLTDSTN